MMADRCCIMPQQPDTTGGNYPNGLTAHRSLQTLIPFLRPTYRLGFIGLLPLGGSYRLIGSNPDSRIHS